MAERNYRALDWSGTYRNNMVAHVRTQALSATETPASGYDFSAPRLCSLFYSKRSYKRERIISQFSPLFTCCTEHFGYFNMTDIIIREVINVSWPLLFESNTSLHVSRLRRAFGLSPSTPPFLILTFLLHCPPPTLFSEQPTPAIDPSCVSTFFLSAVVRRP